MPCRLQVQPRIRDRDPTRGAAAPGAPWPAGRRRPSSVSRVASRPRITDRYISPALARRSSPNNGCANLAISPPPVRSTLTRPSSFGGCQVAAAHQIAQHVNGQRLTLGQGVDHHRPSSGSADPSDARPCPTGSTRPRRRRPTSTPRPVSASDPSGYLIGQQLAQEQERSRRSACANRPELRASSGPSSAFSITSRVAEADSGSRSRRATSPSFHNAVTASGSSLPVRVVITSRAPPDCASSLNDEGGQSVQQVRVVDTPSPPDPDAVARQRN